MHRFHIKCVKFSNCSQSYLFSRFRQEDDLWSHSHVIGVSFLVLGLYDGLYVHGAARVQRGVAVVQHFFYQVQTFDCLPPGGHPFSPMLPRVCSELCGTL